MGKMLGNDVVLQEEFDVYEAQHVELHTNLTIELTNLATNIEQLNKRIDNTVTSISIVTLLIVIFFAIIFM